MNVSPRVNLVANNSKRGLESPREADYRNYPCQDFTTSYLPSGQSTKNTVLSKDQLRRAYHVEHWKKFAAPIYPTVVTTSNYHIVKDKESANYYIETNTVDRSIPNCNRNIFFRRMTDRKEIDTFVNLNDSRFEIINKTPKVLSTVKR